MRVTTVGNLVRAARAAGKADQRSRRHRLPAVGATHVSRALEHEHPLLRVLVVVRTELHPGRQLEQLDRVLGSAGGLADARDATRVSDRVTSVVLELRFKD